MSLHLVGKPLGAIAVRAMKRRHRLFLALGSAWDSRATTARARVAAGVGGLRPERMAEVADSMRARARQIERELLSS